MDGGHEEKGESRAFQVAVMDWARAAGWPGHMIGWAGHIQTHLQNALDVSWWWAGGRISAVMGAITVTGDELDGGAGECEGRREGGRGQADG